ncbi:hypothetical protein MTQ10_10070 [Streptomyces sp. XM83C]|jgi:hypothetical protein|uniref:Lipoprotein n=1 Tax=Streptomyces thermocoprophilus TaxID=78356 RepID=A0ABV5VFG1_9ACTN|nr:hypothetical protein [Streptomyces sp. XM83C]MCK1819954.1 hypothetical protein [Streptomyces sp. XM83C]
MPTRDDDTRKPARTTATRALLAALAALTALTLTTACRDGEGLRDEGPSHTDTPTSPARPGR